MYELVYDMNQKQELIDERVNALEARLNQIQEQLDQLPDIINRGLQAVLSNYKFTGSIDSTTCNTVPPSQTLLHPNDASTRPVAYLASTCASQHRPLVNPQSASLDAT